jgi:hemolysin-activating ACP:hemolysin acyltransferase
MPVVHATAAAPSVAVSILTALPPEVALGRAAAQLMARPAFARTPFGHLVRALAGQINRGHYAFAARNGRTVGFVGWAVTQEAVAEAWITGRRGFCDAEARAGDCLVLNVWQADDAEVSRTLADHLGDTVRGVRRLYARRIYADGRVRPVRLAIRPRA